MFRADRAINMTSDGLALSPAEYARLLGQLSEKDALEADSYCVGGSVACLERDIARILGKEAALVLPTGTMANLLAVQYLAGAERKVIVQRESHIYNDCGDCASALAGLQLVPLGRRAELGSDDIKREIVRAGAGKVDAPVGVLSIESPVRRLDGEMCRFSHLQEITHLARQNGLRLHLDGARLPVAAACSGVAMRDYAALFDTVYVSLYKCFNSLSGGILAGDRELVESLRHWRRRGGGGMAQYWPIASVALHYLPGVVERLAGAIGISEAFFETLAGDPHFEHVPVKSGSSVSRIRVPGADVASLALLRKELRGRGVLLPAPEEASPEFVIKVNESWRQGSAAQLFAAFQDAARVAGISG
jgi:threonine aldolase